MYLSGCDGYDRGHLTTCTSSNIYKITAQCVNNDGSFTCNCDDMTKFELQTSADGGSYCDDNNESDENPCSVDDGTNEVDQLCVNAQGSYVCAFGLRIRRK